MYPSVCVPVYLSMFMCLYLYVFVSCTVSLCGHVLHVPIFCVVLCLCYCVCVSVCGYVCTRALAYVGFMVWTGLLSCLDWAETQMQCGVVLAAPGAWDCVLKGTSGER